MVGLFAVVALVSTAALAGALAPPDQEQFTSRMNERVRRELVTLPYYGVFDNLGFEVSGSVVTLYGQVTRPSTHQDAGRRVSRIPGVSRVVNRIEVLPLSTFDNAIRVRTYRAVFRTGSLYRYALGANPSIHIIVNTGRVTLEGVVSNETDRRLAYVAASGVPGVFSVTNNLRVGSRG